MSQKKKLPYSPGKFKHSPVRQPIDLLHIPLRKEMIFDLRRAVYPFTAFLSSKNIKKTTLFLFQGAAA